MCIFSLWQEQVYIKWANGTGETVAGQWTPVTGDTVGRGADLTSIICCAQSKTDYIITEG